MGLEFIEVSEDSHPRGCESVPQSKFHCTIKTTMAQFDNIKTKRVARCKAVEAIYLFLVWFYFKYNTHDELYTVAFSIFLVC